MNIAKGMAAIGIGAALLLSACPSPTSGGGGGSPNESTSSPVGGALVENSELFEEDENGIYVFQLNDPAYKGSYGYTFWTRTGTTQEPFVEKTVTLSKISGDGTAGYGIVFCYGTTGDGQPTMLSVMINNSQEYIVGEITGAEFTELAPWTETTALKKGQNQANKVRVTLSGGVFTLYLNDIEMTTFQDEDEPKHSGGADGYIVVISPNDDFPTTPVRVTFDPE